MINRKKLEKLIPVACKVIREDTSILRRDGTCDRQYRSLISSFGAGDTMGSLNAAVCTLLEDKSQKAQRPQLLRALYLVAQHVENTDGQVTVPVDQYEAAKLILTDTAPDKEQKYLMAAVALKYALNLFIKEEQNGKPESAVP